MKIAGYGIVGEHSPAIPSQCCVFLLLTALIANRACLALEFPVRAPGEARASIAADQMLLENAVIASQWELRDGEIRPSSLTDKLTGKRVFLMAPIHHHFEKLGWPEQKIVVRFWIVTAILGLVALSSLKLR